MGTPLAAAAIFIPATLVAHRSATQAGAEAFEKGCGGGCHASEREVSRRIPKRPEAERRAWIEAFMALHPCKCDDLKPAIVDYLLERSRP
jgi:hypothetical protein